MGVSIDDDGRGVRHLLAGQGHVFSVIRTADPERHGIELSLLRHARPMEWDSSWVLVQTAKGIGDNRIWRIGKLKEILYLPDVGSKTTSFSSAFAGIFASN